MSDVTVTLGTVSFVEFEVPHSIPWGGVQALNVHKLLGGSRVIDTLGADDEALTWTGRFQGSNALDRAQALDQMRRDGQQQTLTWGGLSYTVVVQRFIADFERIYQQPYSITCEVVAASTLSPASSNATLDDLVGGDMTSAQGLVDDELSPITLSSSPPGLTTAITSTLANLPTLISTPLTALQGAITAVGTLQGASLTALGPVATAAQAATSAIGSVQTALDAVTLTDAGSVAGVIAGQFPTASIASFIDQTNLMQAQSTVLQIGSLVKRVQTNIAQATG